MLIAKSIKDIAQMLSEDVDLVRDLRIGERPSNMKYIRRADLAVLRRREILRLYWDESLLCESKLGTSLGVVAWDDVTVEGVECIDDRDAECECLADRLEFEGLMMARFDTELAADAIEGS